MTVDEANRLLDESPADDKPSRLNPGLTRKQAVEIVRKGIAGRERMTELLIKRVHQVHQDRKRPNY